MADKKMFVIPIYVESTDADHVEELTGKRPGKKIAQLKTTYVDCYWEDYPDEGDDPDDEIHIIFYVGGNVFMSPYRPELIRLIQEAMHDKAPLNDVVRPEINN